MKTVDSTHVPITKPNWQTPKLQELGNLRRFVRTGNAFGKSGATPDGASMPGGEAMSHRNQ